MFVFSTCAHWVYVHAVKSYVPADPSDPSPSWSESFRALAILLATLLTVLLPGKNSTTLAFLRRKPLEESSGSAAFGDS